MNKPNLVKNIYQILRSHVETEYKDFDLLAFANEIRVITADDFGDGYEYSMAQDEGDFIDTYEVMCLQDDDLMFHEKQLLNSVYESESRFISINRQFQPSLHRVIYGH